MNLNMLLKLESLICAHEDLAKFIYEILVICSQQKRKQYIYVYKNIYMSRNIRISIFLVFLMLYIYFPLFSYMLQSMEFM